MWRYLLLTLMLFSIVALVGCSGAGSGLNMAGGGATTAPVDTGSDTPIPPVTPVIPPGGGSYPPAPSF